MQPVSGHGSSGAGKCKETTSKCVIWDGPDINCLGVTLCKGQSIEVIVYNTAKQLCDLLDMLNVNTVDLACLTPPDGAELPQNIIELSQLIITKLCEVNEIVIDLQNTGTTPIYVPLPDCDQIIENCPGDVTTQYTDANGNLVTEILLIGPDGQTSPAVEYMATLICDLLCRMSVAETEIADLRTDVDNLLNQAAGALPPVEVPVCINGDTNPQPIVDPNDPTIGALPDMATLLCDIKETLVDGNPVSTLLSYPINNNADCATNIAAATPLGVYPLMAPPPTDLGDLGAITSPDTLQEVLTNMWVAICDLRNFANIVKANCCPPYCGSVIWQMDAGVINGSRDTVRVILNGSFTDFYGALKHAASIVPSPGFDIAGPPSFYGGNYPYDIIISDQSGNTVTDTLTPISDLFTSGNFADIDTSSLNNLDNYDVALIGYIVAPDFSVCNQTLNITLPAICDNQPLDPLTIVDYGFDGVTIQYTVPGAPWPDGGTTPLSFEIEIIDITAGGILVDTGTIDYGIYPGNEIYIYSDPDNILPNPGSCSGGCINFFQTNNIQPNTTYQIKIRILYNCGTSAWSFSPSFTTFIPIEITLRGSAADVCVLDGSFQLIQDPAVVTNVSANFSNTINFNPSADTVVTVFAQAGTQFGYVLETPYIVETPISTQACPVQQGVRCWGPPSLYKYQIGGIGGTQFTGTETQYDKAGCYDYVNCLMVGDFTTLGYIGTTTVNNIDNTGGPQNKPGNASQILNNTPLPGYDPLLIPAGFDPNTDPVPIKISVDPVLHPLNGGAVPQLRLTVIEDDGPGKSYFSGQGLIYFPPPSITNTYTGITNPGLGIPITVSYNARTQAWLGNAYVSGLPTTSWTSVYTTNNPTPVNQPVGVPAFMKISIYRWSGTSYNLIPNGVYYVTSDWLRAGTLTNIGTTGFLMTNTGLQLRDKIQIEWTTGVTNNALNPIDYPIAGNVPGAAVKMYGKVTVEQDPYSGLISPFIACGARGGFQGTSYNEAISAAGTYGAGCLLYGDNTSNVTNFATSSTNSVIEFVVTGDTNITWNIGYDASIPC